MNSYILAKSFIGFEAVRDREKLMHLFKQGGFDLDPVTTAWCAVFVNSLEVAFGNLGTGKENARSFTTYGMQVDHQDGNDLSDVEEGDIVVFRRGNNSFEGHVTFFVRWVDDQTMECLGGNQGPNRSVCYENKPIDMVITVRRTT